MTDLSSKTCLVFDHGSFLPLAVKLSESFGKVYYHTPCEEAFPRVSRYVIGDGVGDVIRCNDIWAVKNEVDLFVFPDIHHAGLQLELESQGFAVWGSRRGDNLEKSRELFHMELDRVGLIVPPHVSLEGLKALATHLRDKEDKYIKISKYRGDWETSHWRNWRLDSGILDAFAVRFGPAAESIRFMVCAAIQTDIEIGCDTFCVDGQFPDVMLQGYEKKDEGYIGAVRPRESMPECIEEVLQTFGPILRDYRYRNSFTMELRVKDEDAYFTDPCCRCPMPATNSNLELWQNLAEVIWFGANGQIVQPIPVGNFSMECALTIKMEPEEWESVEVPNELKRWMKLFHCVEVGGVTWFPPHEFREGCIGWLVAIGDTLEETLDTMKSHVAALPKGVSASELSLVDLLKEIREAEKQDLEFTEQPVPKPESVVQNA